LRGFRGFSANTAIGRGLAPFLSIKLSSPNKIQAVKDFEFYLDSATLSLILKDLRPKARILGRRDVRSGFGRFFCPAGWLTPENIRLGRRLRLAAASSAAELASFPSRGAQVI
jgi:hypothetical protein